MSRHTTTLIALAMSVGTLRAQQPRSDSTRPQRLPTVTTTASRYAAAPDSLPRRVAVISRGEIDATPALDMVDLLKKRAAIDVVQYPGLLGGIGIRGFRPQVGSIQQRVLILLDGRPSGVTNVSMLDIQDVERVEVLKGPASALYGSSAMGGVVNVVTRRRNAARSGQLSLSGGSFGVSEVRVQGGGRLFGVLDGDVSARRYDQRDNFKIGSGGALRGVFGSDSALKIYTNGTTPNRFVRDTIGGGVTRGFTGMASTSGNARVGGLIANRIRMDVRGDVFNATSVETPGDIYSASTPFPGDGLKDVRRLGGTAEFSGTMGRNALTARAFTSTETSDFYDSPTGDRFVSFGSNARTTGAQVQDVVQFNQQQVVFGVDVTQQRASSRYFVAKGSEAGTFSPNSQVASLAAFAETKLTAFSGRFVATLGGRADRITLSLLETPLRDDVQAGEDVFTVFNPNAGVLINLIEGARVHATIGRAFLAPDAFGRAGFTQNVTAGVAAIRFGNAALRAEQSITADFGAGITRSNGAFDLDVTYFTTEVDNRITSARASFAAGQRPVLASGAQVSRVETSVNAGDANIRGLEAAVRYDLGAAMQRAWSLNAFANVTRIFSAIERTPTVTLDAAQFNGVTNFSPTTILNGVRIGAPNRDVRIKNIATATWNVGLEYDTRSRWRIGLLGRYVGTRTDEDFSDFSDITDIEYPPFAVADFTAGLRVTRRLRADVQVNNVTDENYYEKRGYNLPGRAFTVRVTTVF